MRWLAALAVLLAIVVVGLLLVGEVVLRPMTERAVANDIARRYDLATVPTVELAGSPFLFRAIDGRFDGASVTARDVEVEGLTIAVARLDARDLRFDSATLLSGQPDGTADVVRAEVTVRDRDLTGYIRSYGVPVDLSFRPGSVTVSGEVDVLGVFVAGSATGQLVLEGATLRFVPEQIDLSDLSLPGVANRVAEQLSFAVPVPEVAGIQLTGLEVGRAEATLSADVTDYLLAAAGSAAAGRSEAVPQSQASST